MTTRASRGLSPAAPGERSNPPPSSAPPAGRPQPADAGTIGGFDSARNPGRRGIGNACSPSWPSGRRVARESAPAIDPGLARRDLAQQPGTVQLWCAWSARWVRGRAVLAAAGHLPISPRRGRGRRAARQPPSSDGQARAGTRGPLPGRAPQRRRSAAGRWSAAQPHTLLCGRRGRETPPATAGLSEAGGGAGGIAAPLGAATPSPSCCARSSASPRHRRSQRDACRYPLPPFARPNRRVRYPADRILEKRRCPLLITFREGNACEPLAAPRRNADAASPHETVTSRGRRGPPRPTTPRSSSTRRAAPVTRRRPPVATVTPRQRPRRPAAGSGRPKTSP